MRASVPLTFLFWIACLISQNTITALQCQTINKRKYFQDEQRIAYLQLENLIMVSNIFLHQRCCVTQPNGCPPPRLGGLPWVNHPQNKITLPNGGRAQALGASPHAREHLPVLI